MISTLCNGMWRNDLIKRLVARDHAEVAPSTLLQRTHPRLQIAYFGSELPIALSELVVLCALRCDCRLETTQLADAIV